MICQLRSVALVTAMLLVVAAVGTTDVKPTKALPSLPKIAPISYFEDRCSRCHGPQGSFYGDNFGKGLNESGLRQVVDEMCRNQGDSPLSGNDLEAEIAYHRALIAREPFLAVTRSEAGKLSGEVTEKSVVTVRFKKSAVTAEVKGTAWKVVVPKGERAEAAVITAKLGKRTSVVIMARSAFTHTVPLDSPGGVDRAAPSN